MFSLVPFKKEHVLPLLDQEINAQWRDNYAQPGLLDWLETQASGTVLWNGKPMVCGGVTQYWPGRGHLWTMFNEESKTCFVPTFRGIRKFIKEQLDTNFYRIEVSIPCGFAAGRRRAELLGFRLECAYAERYLPNGEDAAVYVMVRR